MKKIWLKLLLLSIVWFISISKTFWLELDKWDCWIILATWWNFQRIENRSWNNEKVFPKESIKTAMLNLKAFCCKQNTPGSETPSCKYDKENWLLQEQYVDSSLLVDHLTDIWLRRLDAIEKLLYPWVESDPIWKQRREFIKQKAQQKDWTTPTDIISETEKQRTLNTNYILDYRKDWNYAKEYKSWRIEKTKDYENRPLINRYQNICENIAYIYWESPWELNNYIKTYRYDNCKSLVTDVKNRNILYTKVIILKKSNKLLYDNAESYVTSYFGKTRLEKLKDTVLSILQAFSTVNKQVIKLVQECS